MFGPPRTVSPHIASPLRAKIGLSEREKLERLLAEKIEIAGLPTPLKQFYWAKPAGRMFRSDFAYPFVALLIEVQGGIWAAAPGRHNRGSGYEADCERDNLAVLLGWRVLRFTEKLIRNGTAVETIRKALAPVERLI